MSYKIGLTSSDSALVPRKSLAAIEKLKLRFMEIAMKMIRPSTNLAVFVLFFGVATLEAFQTRNWLKAAFWLTIGIVFLVADNLFKKRR